MKTDCEAIYTFDNGEQTFSERAALDLKTEKSARLSIRYLLRRHGEIRTLEKVSLCAFTKNYGKWFADCNGKLFY